MAVTGITLDGHVVFDDLVDDIGRRVVLAAVYPATGLMENGIEYYANVPVTPDPSTAPRRNWFWI